MADLEDDTSTNDGDLKKNRDPSGANKTTIADLLSLTAYFPQIVTTIVILLTIAGIAWFVFGGSIVEDGNKDSSNFARGLITTLFATITAAMALILIFSAMFSSSPDLEKRFSMGKEVLTIFVGILGTIVGFYFGSASSIDTNKPSSTEKILANVVSQSVATAKSESSPATAYMQIYAETQRETAQLLQNKLRDNGFLVPAIENVGDDSGNKADPIKQNLVRYYNDADKDYAERARTLLGTDYVLQKGPTRLKAAHGTIEVWLKTPE